jgi:hypothetical protein
MGDTLPASLVFCHHNRGQKVRATILLVKKIILKLFKHKNTSLTPLKHPHANASTQNTKKMVQKSKIKPV